MLVRARLPLLLALLVLALASPPARAEDPPRADVLAVLDLEPEGGADGLAGANHLPCTVGAHSPLTAFPAGRRVFLSSEGGGKFYVVPDAPGLTACAVNETVHLLWFLSPRRGLVGLGLEPRDEPIGRGAHLDTRVADPERLASHGVPCDGKGDLVSVYDHGHGRWSISTFGRNPNTVEVDAWPFYVIQAPLGEALERATVVLAFDTLSAGGRLLARVEDPTRLASLGIRGMPAGEDVRLERAADGRWTLTTLAPGFTCTRALAAVDPAALGLATPRLLDLPERGSIRGRLTYAWKAAKEGLKGARAHDPVEVVRRPDGTYLLRDLEPKRPVSTPLPSPGA